MEQPLPTPADDGLLRSFLAGDSRACATVERWAWEIVLFRRFRLQREELEDIVQEALAVVWRHASRPGFRLRHGLRAFVRRVAISRAIDAVRRRRPSAELDEALPDPGPGPYEQALSRDRRARLRWALQALDARCRDIIRLHLEEDLSYAEIAAREQRSEATMRVRMFHCLKTLKALVERWT